MKWWWITRPRSITNAWSREERQTVWRIHLIGMPLFCIACFELVMFLFNHGVDPLIVAVVSVVPTYVAAFAAARGIALMLWPDLLRKADENAARRYASYFTTS
jgi:hypothetical protein